METSVNNKCRAFTSLEQSRKLAEILPLESADMYYDVDSYGVRTTPEVLIASVVRKKDIPCWSLAALLGVLKDGALDFANGRFRIYSNGVVKYMDNPVDACVEMIIKLYEQKLL